MNFIAMLLPLALRILEGYMNRKAATEEEKRIFRQFQKDLLSATPQSPALRSSYERQRQRMEQSNGSDT